MRGPFAAVVASIVVLGAAGGPAWAQKKKVVVEQFSGPGSDRFRQSVMTALAKSGVDVVSDKKVANVEADLGLIQVSDAYGPVAKELKVSAFVGGSVTGGKKPRAKLVVHGPDGGVMGDQVWSESNTNKLISAINSNVGSKLAALLGGGGGGDKAEEKAEKKAEKPAPEAVAAAEEPKPKKEAAADDDDGSSKKRKKKPLVEDAVKEEEKPEAEVTASAKKEEPEEPPASASDAMPKGLEIAFVLRMFSRTFVYNQSIYGAQQGYQVPEASYKGLPLVPAPGVAAELFPTKTFGLGAQLNYAIAGSKDSDSSVYKTTAYNWTLQAKMRIALSMMQVEPTLGYTGQVFKIENFSNDPDRIKVAGVDYRQVIFGAGVRVPFAGGSAFSAGLHGLYTMQAGELLDGTKYFYAKKSPLLGKAAAGEGYAGVNFPLSFAKGMRGRVELDIRRIAFAFDVKAHVDDRVAGGAIDQYVGLNLGVGYHIGM
jgi:hypothetical protein